MGGCLSKRPAPKSAWQLAEVVAENAWPKTKLPTPSVQAPTKRSPDQEEYDIRPHSSSWSLARPQLEALPKELTAIASKREWDLSPPGESRPYDFPAATHNQDRRTCPKGFIGVSHDSQRPQLSPVRR